MIGLTEGLITSALYDVAKKILKKDPIRSALDQTIDELSRENQIGWYELREIDRNQQEIFIKHFKDLEKIPNIPGIQSVLRKGETTDGDFFKKISMLESLRKDWMRFLQTVLWSLYAPRETDQGLGQAFWNARVLRKCIT